MISAVKSLLRRWLPKIIFLWYHWLMAWLAAGWYGFPSRQLIVVGVTGTKGKTTVSNLICFALNSLGQSCGLVSTAVIRVGQTEKLNDLKMTMPGRFVLQKYLRAMVRAGNKYAVVETSSEGLAQGRHLGICYDAAIFTNLTPEHIESHGSFANYRQAKLKLWQSLVKKHKQLNGRVIEKISVLNGDDDNFSYWVNYPADKLYIYGGKENNFSAATEKLLATNINSSPTEISFTVNQVPFTLNIGGEFNVYNVLAASAYLLSQGFSLSQQAGVLKNFSGTPGRMEYISVGQKFRVMVDYAHTPESLQKVYHTFSSRNQGERLIAVLGSCGGGRDKAKRPVLGKIAGSLADVVIVTNEDPYDENPRVIIEAVAAGATSVGKEFGKNLFTIDDRRQAVAYALSLAQAADIVVITGKGSEQWLVTNQGKIPWDDRQIVHEELLKIVPRSI